MRCLERHILSPPKDEKCNIESVVKPHFVVNTATFSRCAQKNIDAGQHAPEDPPVSKELFDQKFGAGLVEELPKSPGVYLFRNTEGKVIYVGKAKDLRRRLQTYRNSKRKKAHRKMVRLVKAAASLTFESVATEEHALLRENELIQELKPEFNVDGAFAFLYPAIGVSTDERQTLLCLTTAPEKYSGCNLNWFGTFRSRLRVKLAFDSLVDVLCLIGHREKRNALPPHPILRGSRLVGLRQVPVDLTESLPWFFAGEEEAFLGNLSRLLLQKPRARRDASAVEEKLKSLLAFYKTDAVRLREALRTLGRPGSFVSGRERDALFIQARAQAEL